MNIGTTEFISSMEMDRGEQKCLNNDATTLIITTHSVVDLIAILNKYYRQSTKVPSFVMLCVAFYIVG